MASRWPKYTATLYHNGCMKISIPIDIWDPERGGAERYLRRLATALCARGHEVTILCLEARNPDKDTEPLTVEVLPCPRFPRWLRELVFALKTPRAHRQSGRDLLFAVRHALEADVYHPHGGSLRAGRFAASRSRPFLERTAGAFLAALRPSLWVLLWLDRRVFLRSSQLTTISVSRKVEEDLRRTYPSVRFHFERLYNAVDTTHFHDRDRPDCAGQLRERFGIPPEKRIAVFIAHRFQPKGLLHAVEALGRAENWHLIVAGRDQPGRFARKAARCGAFGRIHFAGPITDTRRLLAGADCLLLPTYYDTCSLAVLEAMACGTPAITTRQNGVVELLEPERSGFVLDSPTDIDGAVRGLHALEKRWRSFHDALVDGVSHLGWKHHVDRMEKILFRALRQT